MKRGGGRRYYRPEDMILLRGIQHLLHAEGYTIKGVQKILREQGVDQVKAFAEKAARLEASQGKGKRGRPARVKDNSSATARAPAVPAKRPPTRDEVIDQLILELESCRALLGAKPTAPAKADISRSGDRDSSSARAAVSTGRSS